MRKTVPQRLNLLANIYEGRNALYGDDFRRYGRVMLALFPDGISIKTEEDLNRLGVMTQMVAKFGRYAANFNMGGHADSLDDLAVYAQILNMLDSEAHGDFELPFPDGGVRLSPQEMRDATGQEPLQAKCEECGGFGMLGGEPCEACSGSGWHVAKAEEPEPVAVADLISGNVCLDNTSGLIMDCPECSAKPMELHEPTCSVPALLERMGQ